ncbi:hypothetical protein BGY98DRAFT_930829 [Russula aff. rugulosa BPL654]|nr:hypothetical protein BGY98DRAFT_930829 [Russula aff. rugulosa BPL654]
MEISPNLVLNILPLVALCGQLPQRPLALAKPRPSPAPGALERPDVWDAGLNRVWKGLVDGGRLKKFLPLRAVVKILYAGWRRDGTWPNNGTVVDEDNFFGSIGPEATG